MLESIFLLLTILGVVIVITVCISGCERNKTDENILKALIIFAGACMVLASIMGRLSAVQKIHLMRIWAKRLLRKGC